ncbi:MAG: UDP-N-acetylglucosamine 1-carboxyvinyltransferase [Patescibacteria group bacterium]|jgi:UDP-N-acetylglucosamine 1-carboxyvinyltransferase
MTKFVIQGGKPLKGSVKVHGAKNAVLPIMASTILANDIFVINNVPQISDVDVLSEILKDLGSLVSWTGDHQLTIDNTHLHYAELDFEKIRKIRSSLMIVGPMLARFGKARFVEPGGCQLGTRSIDTHLHAFEALGAKVEFDGERYEIVADHLTGTRVVLDEMSVTGTANAVMASVLAQGTTEWHLMAAEPENINLMNNLVLMGAKISGIGNHTLTIEGMGQLHGATLTVIPDRMEAATYAVIAAATHGEITIDGYIRDHQDSVSQLLTHIGVDLEFITSTQVRIKPNLNLRSFRLRTDIYPGFPTDVQAPFGVLATQCHGTTEIFETLYDARLGYIKDLELMGGDIDLLDIHRAKITGPTKLCGQTVTCPDIRAGAGLLIAALIADGTTTLNNANVINRGYTAIIETLSSLGADIRIVSD